MRPWDRWRAARQLLAAAAAAYGAYWLYQAVTREAESEASADEDVIVTEAAPSTSPRPAAAEEETAAAAPNGLKAAPSDGSQAVPSSAAAEARSRGAHSVAARQEEEAVPAVDPVACLGPLASRRAAFAENGFIVLDDLLTRETCALLNDRLEHVLRGECDGVCGAPDKAPKRRARDLRTKPGKRAKVPPPLGGPSKTTLQVINIWKADAAFASVVRSPTLGRAVAELAGWEAGARVANDQVWAKPPGAAPLTFHRDSAYFDFVPSDVVTVWIALDDLRPELGPLQYVGGSHLWADGRVGSANQFFDARGRFALLYDAARREGIPDPPATLQVTTLSVKAGGCGIHNGRLWHGSAGNTSDDCPRRGLGIHFVPADARLREAEGRTLAHTLRPAGEREGVTLSQERHPITWPAAAAAAPARARGRAEAGPAPHGRGREQRTRQILDVRPTGALSVSVRISLSD